MMSSQTHRQDFLKLILSQAKGIWRYADFYPPVKMRHQLSLREGNTPLQEFGQAYLKREEFEPTGSVKDRGLAYQVADAAQKEQTHLVISSSGNAALSAAAYCQLHKLTLTVFVGKRIEAEKLKRLQKSECDLKMVEKPLSEAARFSRAEKLRHLRGSLDPAAPIGYRSLAFELYEQFNYLEDWSRYAVFCPVSSGTVLFGVGEGFSQLSEKGFIQIGPPLFAVQTTKIHSIAAAFDNDFQATPDHLVTALVLRHPPRKNRLISVIKRSGGGGVVVDDEQIWRAYHRLRQKGLQLSFESALAYAGYQKIKDQISHEEKTSPRPILLLTGGPGVNINA